MFGLSELTLILIVLVVAIGAKKLPELVRSAGKSARILKAESRAMEDEETGTAPRVIQGEIVTRENNKDGSKDDGKDSDNRQA
ncbi:twin-arginine translocase TatA/TatE family subunit [Streptomyces sp. NPDC002845]